MWCYFRPMSPDVVLCGAILGRWGTIGSDVVISHTPMADCYRQTISARRSEFAWSVVVQTMVQTSVWSCAVVRSAFGENPSDESVDIQH